MISIVILHTSYVAGFPVFSSLGGVNVDVDQDAQAVNSLDGNENAERDYMLSSGLNASSSESHVLELSFNEQAESAAKVLAVAAEQRLPTYQVTASNVDSVLPQLDLSGSVKAEIQEAANQGLTVITPRADVSIGRWHGAGYVVVSGDGGADYRIEGGASGGSWEPEPVDVPGVPTDKKSLGIWVAKFLGFDETVAACVSIILDIVAVWTLGSGFASFAATWDATLVLASTGIGAVLAMVLAVVAVSVLFLYSALSEWNDAIACEDGLTGDELGMRKQRTIAASVVQCVRRSRRYTCDAGGV